MATIQVTEHVENLVSDEELTEILLSMVIVRKDDSKSELHKPEQYDNSNWLINHKRSKQ